MSRSVFLFKPRLGINSFNSSAELTAYSIGSIVEFACTACHRIRSRDGAFECEVEDENGFEREVFVCAECLDDLHEADRFAEEAMRMMEAAEPGGAA